MAAVEKRRYRKVICRMYGDAKFLQLSRPQPNGQSLWTYLITGPHTTSVPGLFQAGEAQLAEALWWSLRGFRKAWSEIEGQGMAQADWQARVIWLPNAIRYNVPENPNVVKGWQHALDEIPSCALKATALVSLKGFLKGLGPAFAKAFQDTLEGSAVDPLANQEQEQEQEQESTPLPPGGGVRPTRKERARAEEILRKRFGHCHHDPECGSHTECLAAIVAQLRERVGA